jgi:hypothetical protein
LSACWKSIPAWENACVGDLKAILSSRCFQVTFLHRSERVWWLNLHGKHGSVTLCRTCHSLQMWSYITSRLLLRQRTHTSMPWSSFSQDPHNWLVL